MLKKVLKIICSFRNRTFLRIKFFDSLSVFSRFFCLTNFIMIFCFGCYSLRMPHAHNDNDAPTQRTHTVQKTYYDAAVAVGAAVDVEFAIPLLLLLFLVPVLLLRLLFALLLLHTTDFCAVALYTPFLFIRLRMYFCLLFLRAASSCIPFVQKFQSRLRSLALSSFVNA